jgi:hypothetical protein
VLSEARARLTMTNTSGSKSANSGNNNTQQTGKERKKPNLQATGLKAANDLTDQLALHAVRLDADERALMLGSRETVRRKGRCVHLHHAGELGENRHRRANLVLL